MRRRLAAAAVAACLAGAAMAQFNAPVDPDWREADVPPPPPLATTGLVALDVARAALSFGVDPRSVAVGSDLVVRYVVVARSDSGAVNGIYEGLNCRTGEVKVYARHNPDKGWVRVEDAKWVPLREGVHAGYSLVIARQGACIGSSPNRPASRIVQALGAPDDTRFRPEAFR